MNTKTLFQSTLWTLAVTLLAGCTAGTEDSPSKNGGPITQAPCSETTKTFDSAGAAQPNLSLATLPAGIYRYENSEAYVETKIVSTGAATRISRIQYLEREIGRDPAKPAYETGLRCRETVGSLTAFTTQLALPTDLKRYNAGYFDVETRLYNIAFRSTTSSSLSVAFGGEVRSADAGTVASQIGSTWNGGYHFARRSDEVYELHGLRIEANRTIYGKVVYTREKLSANSQ